MRKHFYSLFAAASMMLAVTSCSQEEDYAQQSSGEMTTFSVSLNGATQSRTAGDGETANKLYYEVYHGENCIIDKDVTISDGKYSIELPLLKGEKYDIIFWAQASDGSIYNAENLKTISVNYGDNNTVAANAEAYDAFYNALNQFQADGKVHTIELRRPFAQLNLGTGYNESEETPGDWQKAQEGLPKDGEGKKQAPVTKTKAVVKGLATTFSPLTGEASGNEDVTFDYAEIPDNTFKVDEKEYKYLSLNYLLVPGQKDPQGLGEHDTDGNKTNVDIEFTLKRGETELFTIEVPNAPIQRNWRTNVIGDLLTGTKFDVVVKPETDDDNNVEIENIKGIDELNTALSSNTSTEQVIYDISGLSTTDVVTIEIPNTFVASQVTFNLNDIKDDAKLTIKDKDTTREYPNTVCVKLPTTEGHNLTSTTITLPKAHVELSDGNFGDLSATTSDETIVIGADAVVSTLTVEQGNVVVYGEVSEIEVSENNESTVIVTLGEGANVETIDESILVRSEVLPSEEEETESEYVAKSGEYYYKSLADAIKVIAEAGEIKMMKDIILETNVEFPTGKTITLDLNGHKIEGTDKKDTGSFGLIDMQKGSNLSIVNTAEAGGEITLTATTNRNWNAYSSVISNQRATLSVGQNVVIEHLGGTDMAYGIDNLTNTGADAAITTVDGATIKSTYRAIRQFLNSSAEGVKNELYVKSGSTIYGTNKSIWMQDANTKANPGKLVVEEDVTLNGAVYLFVAKGSTEWPVEVSIPTSVLSEENLMTANLPDGYAVVEHEETWTVVNSLDIANLASLEYFREQVNNGNSFKDKTVKLAADIDLNNEQWSPIGTSEKPFVGTFDGGNYTIKNLSVVETEAKEGKAYIGFFGYAKNATIQNVTFENVNLNIACLDIDHSQGHIGAVAGSLEGTSTIENVTVKGDIKVEATVTANGASRVAVVAGGNLSGNVTMKNVHVIANEGSYLKANNNVGALAGQLQEKNVFENCTSNIDVTGTKFFAGGLIGLAAGNSTFTNCHTTGDVTITAGRSGKANDHYRVGGIAGGWADNVKTPCVLTNCTYTGTVSGTNADGSIAEPLDYEGYVGRGYTLTNKAGSKVIIDGKQFEQQNNDKFGIYVVSIVGEAALKAAFAEGGEILLGADITVNETLTLAAGKTAVLKLNGKTLAAADKNTIKNEGGNLTIKNGTVTRTGDVVGYSVNNASGEITVEDATIERGLYTSGSKMTATNANISHEQSSRHAIYAWNCEVTINNGTFHNDNAGNATLMASGSSVVTINGGTFSIADGRSTLGWTSSMMDQNSTAQVTVKGGLFNGGFRINSADTKLTIEGGEFNTNNGSAFTDYEGTKIVTGGKFTGEGAQTWAKKYLAEGYTMNENGEVVKE